MKDDLRRELIRAKVSKARSKYKDLGLSPLQLWLPLESFHKFKALAVNERVTCNSKLPTDLADLARFQPDIFGVSNSDIAKIKKVRLLVADFAERAHPSSPRWSEARKLLQALEEVL